MYCVNESWIGDAPQCIPKGQIVVHTTMPPNPCLVNNGGCQHHCTNREGEAECGCYDGFRPRGRSARRCQDINECRRFNGGCAHVCTNKKGGYTCSCHKGFSVHVDQHACVMDSYAHQANNRRRHTEKIPPYVLFH
ncbi:hypothetical protein CAPTEDRAFT_153449 [Capitella teleta]|uniref:EGF-like domain-containing protein n=1 Tax=Capitella teleta TaxID=283909 RepID=R7UA85_CAPTE|nr:hypothetical protein CAPTEDRAFT_153449 [Capitella teleta]|eukprot:ELU00051.1 hypothetical protein CAPTEDRAFT_153449 [Capitella teleta]